MMDMKSTDLQYVSPAIARTVWLARTVLSASNAAMESVTNTDIDASWFDE